MVAVAARQQRVAAREHLFHQRAHVRVVAAQQRTCPDLDFIVGFLAVLAVQHLVGVAPVGAKPKAGGDALQAQRLDETPCKYRSWMKRPASTEAG